MSHRYRHTDLIACTDALFTQAGVDAPIAHAMAEILVEADLLGYDTHGLQFVPAFLSGIESGRWRTAGDPEVLRDEGHIVLLHGHALPGQWVMREALELATGRAAAEGVVVVAVREAQNIACLASYARRAAEQGLLAVVMASAPGNAAVAPHGGRNGRLSTNPIALGIPTSAHPILIDTSSAATSNRQVERHRRAGTRLPLPSLVSAEGRPTDDPEALSTDPPGAILPGGGVDYGHKGFAMSLMVEALTSGLLGWGRAAVARSGGGVGNSVYLQVMHPAAFGGEAGFREEMAFLAEACRGSQPLAGGPPVRVPGDRAQARYEAQLAQGVELHPEIMPRLEPALRKYGVVVPAPLG